MTTSFGKFLAAGYRADAARLGYGIKAVSQPQEASFTELEELVARLLAAGTHSRQLVREICRRFGGKVIPMLEEK